MASLTEHVALARSLPPRLLHFFKRWPPPQIAAPSVTSPTGPTTNSVQIASNTSPSDPNESVTTSSEVSSSSIHTAQPEWANATWKKNPFLPFKNPRTGNWHGPHYSLRRQAELFKLARKHGVLPLMPLSAKHPEVKEASRIEQGLRVKGTGVGQRVKGKHWERTMRAKLDLRRKAMETMPDLINAWRLAGHGKGWKKYPRSKPNEGDVFNPTLVHAWARQPSIKGLKKRK